MKLVITERLSFAAGTPFGETGPYERLKARFHGAVDPAQQPITDIAHAPTGPAGLVP